MNGQKTCPEWSSCRRRQLRGRATRSFAKPSLLRGVVQGGEAVIWYRQPIQRLQQRQPVLELGHHAPARMAESQPDRCGTERTPGPLPNRKNPTRRPSPRSTVRVDLVANRRMPQIPPGRPSDERGQRDVEEIFGGGRSMTAVWVARRPGYPASNWTAGRGRVARRQGQWWPAGRATPRAIDPPAGPVGPLSAVSVTRRPGTSINLPCGGVDR